MWHTLHNVATNRFYNPALFTSFALANRNKFQLDELDTVSTWFTNDLCAAYEKYRGADAISAERDEHIRLYRQRYNLPQ